MSFLEEPVRNFQQLLEVAQRLGPKRIAVAVAQKKVVLQSVHEAEKLGLADAVLIGDQEEIIHIGNEIDWQIPAGKIVNELDYTVGIRRAVEMVRAGEASMIMKGKATSADIYRVALDKEMGLRTGRFLSQVVVFKLPQYDRLMLMSDSSVSITPNLLQKADICRNCIDVAHALGISMPKVAAIAALELVNPDIPSTVDAACLAVMNQRNQITGAIIDGPISIDAALTEWAAEEKGFKSCVAGCTDIFACPNLDAANIFLRAINYLAQGDLGGVVVGAAAPILVLSRAESVETKINSICLGVLLAGAKEQGML